MKLGVLDVLLQKTEFTVNLNSVKNAVWNAEKIDYGLYKFLFKQKLRVYLITFYSSEKVILEKFH